MADPNVSNFTESSTSSVLEPCCHSNDTSEPANTSQSENPLPALTSCCEGNSNNGTKNIAASDTKLSPQLSNENSLSCLDDSVANESKTDKKVKKEKISYTKWTNQQRAYCVKQYYYQKCTFKGLGPEFCKFFKASHAPDRKVIKRWVAKFEAYGTVDDFKKARDDRPTNSGRPKKRTTEVVATIYNSIEIDPDLSLRARAKKLGIPRSTLRRAMREDIKRPMTSKKKDKSKKETVKKPKEIPLSEKTPPRKNSYIETPWGTDGTNFELYAWADFMGGCGGSHTPNPSVSSVVIPAPSVVHPQRCLAPPLHSVPQQSFFHAAQNGVKIESAIKEQQ